MRRLGVLNLAQRVTLIVALGAVLLTVGGYTTRWGPLGGGAAHIPPQARHVYAYEAGSSRWLSALLWIALVVAWGGVSVWLLGLPRRPTGK